MDKVSKGVSMKDKHEFKEVYNPIIKEIEMIQ